MDDTLVDTRRNPNESPPETIAEDVVPEAKKRNGFRFWMIFLSLTVSTFLAAIDLTSVSITLPTIVADLKGDGYAWVGSGYALGSSAVLPLIGGLAQIFGRRPVVLGSLLCFAAGSAISGAAMNMPMLISGRVLQGIGGGGILTMTEIVMSDLVPLSKRGLYMGIISGVWGVASAVGPPVGGAFSQSNWRWLFYMNLPICAIAAALASVFLRLKVPQDDLKSKMKRMDWFGNFLVIVSSAVTIIALTWAGVTYPWGTVQVLVPLVMGMVGLAGFFLYEATIPAEPVIPWSLVNNRTACFGQFTAFLHSLVSTALIYYLPVYFQGALLQSPVRSGISVFGSAFTIAPGAIICGIVVSVSAKYKPMNIAGWALTILGFGLLSMLKETSSTGIWVGFQIVSGFGLGLNFPAPDFPVLSAAPVTENAHVLALMTFVRTFAQTWGVAIGAAILQNEFTSKTPSSLLDQISSQTGTSKGEVVYALIPAIKSLPPDSQALVRRSFAHSIDVIWLVMLGLSALGFVCAFAMRELPMHDVTDGDWGMEGGQEKAKDATV